MESGFSRPKATYICKCAWGAHFLAMGDGSRHLVAITGDGSRRPNGRGRRSRYREKFYQTCAPSAVWLSDHQTPRWRCRWTGGQERCRSDDTIMRIPLCAAHAYCLQLSRLHPTVPLPSSPVARARMARQALEKGPPLADPHRFLASTSATPDPPGSPAPGAFSSPASGLRGLALSACICIWR